MIPDFYKGWDVVIDKEQLERETKLAASVQKLLEWLRDYMSVDTATLLLPSDQRNLAVYTTIGLEEEITQEVRIPIGKGFAGTIAASNEPIIVNDVSQIEVVSPILRDSGLRSLIGIPLPVKQSKIGVLHVGTTAPKKFTQSDVQQMQRVANLIEGIIADTRVVNNQVSGSELVELSIPTSCVKKQRFASNFSLIKTQLCSYVDIIQNWRGFFHQSQPLSTKLT
ncbi:GAF domain-containing protein [Iningainema tapete]|uniref:GAF domain-containing protein n=1 Tax=Iningainema tapete TaxID=2806730 RepID=UPI003080AFA4